MTVDQVTESNIAGKWRLLQLLWNTWNRKCQKKKKMSVKPVSAHISQVHVSVKNFPDMNQTVHLMSREISPRSYTDTLWK